jgi:hypothetical protein
MSGVYCRCGREMKSLQEFGEETEGEYVGEGGEIIGLLTPVLQK